MSRVKKPGDRRNVPPVLLLLIVALTGCRQDMHDQPRYKPLAASSFFADGRSARDPVPGTVARGHLDDDDAFHTGRENGELLAKNPLPLTREVMERGHERFNIYCSPCHGVLGDGRGMVVRRGFQQPNSYHTERLREAPDGHFFDAISHGFGAMPSYAARIPVRDRWAIIWYVRALQLSRQGTLDDAPPAERTRLEQTP